MSEPKAPDLTGRLRLTWAHPFVPDGDHFEAVDWVVVEKNEC